MNLVRVGLFVINFDQVTYIFQGDPDGPPPEAVIVHFVGGGHHTFTGDDAEAVREYLARTTKRSKIPRTDGSFE